MADVWTGGGVGTISLDDVHQAVQHRLGLDEGQLGAFMGDLWREYLGSANTQLIGYVRRLRLRYRTGIVSNSFVGKPDPRIYALICRRLDVAPSETVILDDVGPYVVGAREAGIHAVYYENNAQAMAEIEELLSTP